MKGITGNQIHSALLPQVVFDWLWRYIQDSA